MTTTNTVSEWTEIASRRESTLWGWLPTRGQMANALLLDFRYPIMRDEDAPVPPDSVAAISMRQGMGMLCLAALAAGLLPSFLMWVTGLRVGAAAPLAQMAADFSRSQSAAQPGAPLAIVGETAAALAGLEPAFFPGWLAAGVTAAGQWLEWPLHWLAIWIVYGLVVLVLLKLFGATTTLQRFYAMSAYGTLPLMLLGLQPIPCIGFLASLIGYVWAALLVVQLLRAETQLATSRVVASLLMPGLAAMLISFLVAGALAVSIVSLIF